MHVILFQKAKYFGLGMKVHVICLITNFKSDIVIKFEKCYWYNFNFVCSIRSWMWYLHFIRLTTSLSTWWCSCHYTQIAWNTLDNHFDRVSFFSTHTLKPIMRVLFYSSYQTGPVLIKVQPLTNFQIKTVAKFVLDCNIRLCYAESVNKKHPRSK